MIGIEDRPRSRQIDLFFTADAPRQLDHPIEISSDHRSFRGHLRHALEAAELAKHFRFHGCRHFGIGNFFSELFDFDVFPGFFAELFLNRLQLFPQEVLALRLIERLFGLVADFLAQLQQGNLPGQLF